MDTTALEHRIEELHSSAAALQVELVQAQRELHCALAAIEPQDSPQAAGEAAQVVTKAKLRLGALSTALDDVQTHCAYKEAQSYQIEQSHQSEQRQQVE